MVDGAADAAGQTTAAAGDAASDEAADEAAATVVPAVPTEEQFAWLAENADQFPAHKVELADGSVLFTMDVTVSDAEQMRTVMRRLEQISGVMRVSRPAR